MSTYSYPDYNLLVSDDLLSESESETLFYSVANSEANFHPGQFTDGTEQFVDTAQQLSSVYRNAPIVSEILVPQIAKNTKAYFSGLEMEPEDFSKIWYEHKINSYGDKSFLKPHSDCSDHHMNARLISVVHLVGHRIRKFSGGDFIIYSPIAKKKMSIPFEPGITLIFPSKILHSVMEVNMKSQIFADRRISVTTWIRNDSYLANPAM